ncbi:MAG: sulfurtransferase [gamma proteobacterium symbiont of Bathyaustriella thionipta]|nr:sulfurtransferase [gamma proteobacterium symbiont of Bathyaustriella thionipta]MCU7951142.1 sulfurtransferase [gamma proteobacterium symbiont of Bathyaustriella thionipta]MCU7952105.1 sulfurtransferase [gamma proteobacterium symbiont of Bathyaustriella thionipta]MCU7957836.1 sulfurtransferase [gamma proteobacterium symbiont of Bathyaustriella thionipta]MCU7967199.1 sulfurtransferase [gamma proteobacterium symbiont of Bathyaustriella thionipta]
MKKITITSGIFLFFLLSDFVLSVAIAEESLRISPEQLKHQLSDKNLIILDARSSDAYLTGHIENALSFPVNLTYKNKNLNGKISQPAVIQQYFRSLGITVNSQVVVYDNGDIADAARLFWVLEVYGIKQIKILDHGYDDWQKKSYPMSIKQAKPTPSQYIATLNHMRLASKFTTQLATRNANQIVIDARNFSDYIGKTSTDKRFGHIPSAIHIAASHNLAVTEGITSLRPLKELEQLYQRIPKDRKVVIYCAIGRVSSTNYLALRELGYDVSNYDASWNEWGNDDKLPIEK